MSISSVRDARRYDSGVTVAGENESAELPHVMLLDRAFRVVSVTGDADLRAHGCEPGRPSLTEWLPAAQRAPFTRRLTRLRQGRLRSLHYRGPLTVPGRAEAVVSLDAHLIRPVVADAWIVVVVSRRENGPDETFTMPVLTARVLEGIAAGLSTADIGAELHLTVRGVEYHVSSLLRRTSSTNRAGLVGRAHALGILLPGSWPPRVDPALVR
ncbi:hypothetical protein Asp14428_16990 [Actinoplanes sp. NBRC 14428]|uniref:Regulatory LuxR family protein n=1 Tax=Pseudosporangium ferrugineum TaxID=439699 RepID=A0A2T0SB76_9ACTN|nr:helix-turn-helix transcriptional regulator [Pseudosporangium ferrugineum]PRY30679.1 regulatory LuxR family protein [Pseudosporangium ferrugineum]BCJ50224.1 hypothetical protein Asp14428_16990 [Actinoplanes sp. NBRC 14428]